MKTPASSAGTTLRVWCDILATMASTATVQPPRDLATRHAGVTFPPGHTCGVGLNPYRKHRRRPSDYVLVGGCLVVVAALVVWAFFG